MRSTSWRTLTVALLVVCVSASCSSEKPKVTGGSSDVALESKLFTLEEKIDAVAASQARSEGADPEKVAKLEREVRELTELVFREFVEPTQKPEQPRPKSSASDQLIATLEKQVAELQQRLARLEGDLPTDPPSYADLKRPAERQRAGAERLDWRLAANWRGLKRGMSKDQVSKLFGEPTKIDTSQYLTIWYYGYPSGGQIGFDAMSDKIDRWREP